MASLLRKAACILPAAWQRAAKRLYYPRVLRRFRAEQWPGASLVERLLRPGDVVVDAGANVGYVSMLLARWVGAAGRVYSFEPVPETFDLLCHNMRALGLDQVVARGVALSSCDGVGRMAVPQYPDGGENFYEAHLVGADTQLTREGIPLRRLDDLLADEARAIAFIKVDVEGHEWEMAQGAHGRLTRDRPALFVELSGPPHGEGASGCLCRYLSDLGYGAYWLEQERLQLVRPTDRPVDAFFLTEEHLRRLESPLARPA